MTVDAEAGGGDSGSPVFKITSGTNVNLPGIVFTCYGTIYECLDPVTGKPIYYCTQFAASNLGGVEMDLNPDGWPLFVYH